MMLIQVQNSQQAQNAQRAPVSHASQPAQEEVVLLNESGDEIGTMPKAYVHGEDTALHLAFSCHLFSDSGEVLVSRRALTKQTWPGVWSNSFCGHPRPAEALQTAVRRRAEYELGVAISGLEVALPLFRYRAVDASGIVENEICPVYLARCVGRPKPNSSEVMDYEWVNPASLGASARLTPWAFSPWLVLQAHLLDFLGGAVVSVDSARESERIAG
jgi:isopentenyl-diphosphate Delta-isomerase